MMGRSSGTRCSPVLDAMECIIAVTIVKKLTGRDIRSGASNGGDERVEDGCSLKHFQILMFYGRKGCAMPEDSERQS